MNLHLDNKAFGELLEVITQKSKFDSLILQKDYWVTYILKLISQHPEYRTDIVFKGGTSLSKCHSAIERFSEDIDLCVYKPDDSARGTKGEKIVKKLNEIIPRDLFEVEKVIDGDRAEDNRIRKHSAKFKNPIHTGKISGAGDFNKILVEVNRIAQPTPFENVNAQTLIYHELMNAGMEDVVTEFDLHPFSVQVMSLQRTFCEKISGVARNSASFKSAEYRQKRVRHYYDLYKLYHLMGRDFMDSEGFDTLMFEVMEDDYKGSNKSKDMYQKNLLIHDLKQIETDLNQTWNDFKGLLFPGSELPELKEVLTASRLCIERAAKAEEKKYA